MPARSRRKSAVVQIGSVQVGGSNPIVVQSMTNTDTADSASTINQIMQLARAGSELVRVTVNTDEAAQAVPTIVDTLRDFGVDVPIIGDFHYNGHLLLKKYPACARALSKYRINPGNVNIGRKQDDNFRIMIEAAIEYDRPVRIGVNWGSLDSVLLTQMMDDNSKLPEPLDAMEVTRRAIVESALRSAENAERYGLAHDKIILSAKVSNVQDLVDVYEMLAQRCDYALHLGLTEAGLGSKGIVATTAALSVLLAAGHRRHDPRLFDAYAERRSHRRSDRQPADSASAEFAQLHSAGGCLSRLRADDEYVFPGHGRPNPNLSA